MLRFSPWVGEQYETGGVLGVRLLILGESHYGPPAWDYPDFTRDVIRNGGLTRRDRFLTTVAKTVLVGNPGWLPDQVRQAFFQSVAFYNYVQRMVGEKARQRPTPEMWAEAREPFLGVLAALRPQAVVVLGTELWANLPPGEAASVDPEFRAYRLPDGTLSLAARVAHPSSWGYRSSDWQPKVQTLLHAAGLATHSSTAK